MTNTSLSANHNEVDKSL